MYLLCFCLFVTVTGEQRLMTAIITMEIVNLEVLVRFCEHETCTSVLKLISYTLTKQGCHITISN